MKIIIYRIKSMETMRIFLFWVLILTAFIPRSRAAESLPSERLGLFITGLSGTNQFKTTFEQAADYLRQILLLNGYQMSDLVKFAEVKSTQTKKWGYEGISTSDQVRAYLKKLSQREKPFKQVFLFIGAHANGRDEEAKVHLPGRDMIYKQLISGLDAIPAEQMIVIVAAPQGITWIEHLSKPGRVIIVGNGYREYDFIPELFLRTFPEMFTKLSREHAENSLEKNRPIRISLRDVFVETQRRVRHWYWENNLQNTEMALLDANGDKRGESLLLPEALENSAHKKEIKDPLKAISSPQIEEEVKFPMDLQLPDAQMADAITFITQTGGAS